ncbi:putative prophage PSSB64-02, Orf53 [Pseudomonas syringae pv. atrofaciens]|nr:putative prophage PSSB64-02, Orf53 [Pseudomonas syringae pv. atrofaciens]
MAQGATMSEAQQVITIDDISADNAPAIYVTGGLNQFLQAVTAEVTAEVPDLTTRKGRDRIASLAAKVSKSKTAVEKPGRDYLKRLKEMPKVVETELREFVTKMDALRDATRKPLTDWEEANDRRIDAHNDGIQRIKDMAVFAETPTAAHVAQIIADLELVEINDSWEEFLAEAAQAKDRSLATLRTLLADRTKHEAELAEIAKFNAEKAEREQKERDAEIARQAVERAQREAEQKAQAEREAGARREQDLKDQAEAQQRAAEQKLRDAEAEAERQRLQIKLQQEKSERQKLQAEQDRIAGMQRAESERVAAEQRQAEAVERARLAEVKRQADAKAEELRQQKAREDDKAHKASINRAALEAFIAGGMPEDCARQAVTLIAQRKIPNISVQY